MLRDSDPRLVALFSIFTRLTWDEEMPRIEEVRARLARFGGWLTAAMPSGAAKYAIDQDPVELGPLTASSEAATSVWMLVMVNLRCMEA